MMLHRGEWKGKRILKTETVAEVTHKQTGDLAARPGMPWGSGFCVVEDPSKMAANSVLTAGSFGHGGAFSTQSWADPVKNLIWIVMFQRDGKGIRIIRMCGLHFRRRRKKGWASKVRKLLLFGLVAVGAQVDHGSSVGERGGDRADGGDAGGVTPVTPVS